MIILLDNYDSFTYNLFHFLQELGVNVRVIRNDEMRTSELMALGPKAIVLSPGPCDPDQAGISLELVKKAHKITPILGVCLGHQTIGQAFGGKIVRAPELMHGKLSDIHHKNGGIFKNIPPPFQATRYHSLIIEKKSMPNALMETAWTEDKMIMGVAHKKYPVFGIQFHPESIGSQYGHALLANFLKKAGIKHKKPVEHERPAILSLR